MDQSEILFCTVVLLATPFSRVDTGAFFDTVIKAWADTLLLSSRLPIGPRSTTPMASRLLASDCGLSAKLASEGSS
jgi:hypothetical protein